MHMDVEVGAMTAMVVQAPLFLVMEDQESCMVVGQVMVAVVVTILMQGRSCLIEVACRFPYLQQMLFCDFIDTRHLLQEPLSISSDEQLVCSCSCFGLDK